MAPLPDYVTGTITLTNNSAAFTGSGTGWLAAGFREGDTILGIEDNPGVVYVVESVTDNDSGTLTQPWDGPTGTYTYRMRYLSDGQRVTAQARQLIEMLGNGNLQAVAGLPGTPQTLMMFTGPGAMVEVPRTDLVSGVNYDVQVDTLAERAAYDGSDEGFSVLVADTGDGRAAIYSKLSNAAGDWSDPAYITGPVSAVEVGDVTNVPFGDGPNVTSSPITGGIALNFELEDAPTLTFPPVTTVASDQDAEAVVTPVTGGYSVQLSIPRGPAGDIDGVTTFWQGRITVDATAGAARTGLGATTVGSAVFTATDAGEARTAIGAEPARAKATQSDAEAGTGTTVLGWAPEQIAQAILALAPSGGDVDPNLVAFNTFKIADLDGQRLGFAGGFADPFDDDTGIDAGASSDYTYDAINDRFMPTATPATLIPQATGTNIGNMTGSGGLPAAFDNSLSTRTQGAGDGTSYVGKSYSGGKLIGQAVVQSQTGYGFNTSTSPTPVDLTVYAKNGAAPANSTDGTVIGATQSSTVISDTKTFNITNVGPWDHVWVRTQNSTFNGVAELRFYEPAAISNMTLVSDTLALPADPGSVRALVEIHAAEAVTANTDFTLAASRDDGITFTDAVLEPYFGNFYQAVIDVSGQPAGNDLRMRFQSLNNKNVGVSGWFAQVM